MKTSDDLFRLVKSLNKAEIRHFRLFSSLQSGSKAYLKLFNAMQKQKEYDEDSIRKEYSNELFVKQLSRAKNYLYDQLMKSLELLQTGIDEELRRLISQIEILYAKELYSYCWKVLDKTKELAYKYEKHLILLHLYDWEMTLIYTQGTEKKTEKNMNKILAEKALIAGKYNNIEQYRAIEVKYTFGVKKKGAPRTSKGINIYNSLLDNPLIKDEKNMQSFRARMFGYLIRSGAYMVLENFTSAHKQIWKTLKLMDQNPLLKVENTRSYIGSLYNLALIYLYLKKHHEIAAILKRLREINSASLSTNTLTFSMANYLELEFYKSTGDYVRGLRRMEEIENESKRPVVKEYWLMMSMCMVDICFISDQFNKANSILNKVLHYFQQTKTDLRNDLYFHCKIYSLIIHFELRNTDFLEYAVRSTYRFLLKRKRVYKFERVFLSFIRKDVPNMNTREYQTVAFKKLKGNLLSVFKDPSEKKILQHYFDIIAWLDSKIESKPIAEVVKEKALSK